MTIHGDVRTNAQSDEVRAALSLFISTHEPLRILAAWRVLKAGAGVHLVTRAYFRRAELHLALAGTDGEHLVRREPDGGAFLDTLFMMAHARKTSESDMPAMDVFADDALRSPTDETLVEPDANSRTEAQHRRARLAVAIALHTPSLDHFLHALALDLNERVATPFTGREQCALRTHLEQLLASDVWPHPTKEMAEQFACCEIAFAHAICTPEERVPVAFLPAAPRQTKTAALPGPSAIGAFIFNENGARTGTTRP